jgi:hypothetical protein
MSPLESALWKVEEILTLLRPYSQLNLPPDDDTMREVTDLYDALNRATIRVGVVMDRMTELRDRR